MEEAERLTARVAAPGPVAGLAPLPGLVTRSGTFRGSGEPRKDAEGVPLAPDRGAAPSATRGGTLLACAALLWLMGGCGLVKPALLEVPAGHHVVLGRVELSALDVGEAALEILKEDGTFSQELSVGLGHEDFALALPAGRYRIVRIRAMKDRARIPNNPVSDVRLVFQSGPEPAAYIGTLRLSRDLREQLRVTVADEYERTVATLRARYADLPAVVVRRLVTPA